MHDVNILDQLVWEAGSSYIMDRGYLDFARWHRLHQCGACFVTRPVDKTAGLRYDQTIVMTGLKAKNDYPDPLRRSGYRDPITHRAMVFLTNFLRKRPLHRLLLYGHPLPHRPTRLIINVYCRSRRDTSVKRRMFTRGAERQAWSRWKQEKKSC